jgi:hypothetical protein
MRIEFGSPRGFLNWYARDGGFGRDRLLPTSPHGGWLMLPVSGPWFERWSAGDIVCQWLITIDDRSRITSWRPIYRQGDIGE